MAVVKATWEVVSGFFFGYGLGAFVVKIVEALT